MRLTITKDGQLRRKHKARNHAEHLVQYRIKKGQTLNPGGKPKVFQRFSQMFVTSLMQPAPRDIAKRLGLKRGATKFDALIEAMIHSGMEADVPAFHAIHELIEGKLVQPYISLTAHAELESKEAQAKARRALHDVFGIKPADLQAAAKQVAPPPTLQAAPVAAVCAPPASAAASAKAAKGRANPRKSK